MKIFDSNYYKLNKRALLFYGQWPFQSNVKNRFSRIMIFFIIMSITIPKFIKFFESLNDMDELILCLPMMVLHSVALIKFFCWNMTTKNIKKLIETIQIDWDTLKLEDDRALLHNYSERGRVYMLLYAVSMFGILAIYLVSPGIPTILDLIAPLNQSRPRIFLYETEYFVDQDKYYFYILLHAYMTVPVSVGAIVFFDHMYTIYINHACGMFAIVSKHLTDLHVIKKYEKEVSESNRWQNVRNKIAYCVKLHKNTFDFIDLAESSGNIALLLIVGLNTLIITVTGMSTVLELNKPSQAIRNLAFTIGGIFHLFYTSYQGNLLIEQSGNIYRAAYLGKWYTFPPNLQKLLIPIMMRSRNPCYLTAGKVYIFSMENFSEVLRRSMSFFTVLNSAR